MGTGAELTLAETAEKLHKFADRLEKASHPINTNTVSTVFNLGGAGLVFGFCFGSICLGAAIGLYFRLEAREEVMAAERRADMAGLSALMSRVEGVESQVRADRILISKTEQRIVALESR